MLSRLISLLRRIPAVKWAFTRLRSSPRGGSVDIAPSAAAGPATIVDVVETAPAPVADIGVAPQHDGADLAVAAPPAAENDTAVCAVAESPSTDICANDASAPESPTEAEAVLAVPAVEEASVSPPDLTHEPVAAADVVTDISSDIPTPFEPVVAEVLPLSSARVETALKEVPDAVAEHGPSLVVSTAIDPLVNEIPAVDADSVAADASSDGGSSPNVEITPLPANDPPAAATIDAEARSAEPDAAVTNIEPPAPVSPASEARNVRNVRARPAEPADRAALIRQRWAETGVRMWNPRLHGTGDATLNIQGSIGLLPPAPGETMPRYDKLEFKMLGGQIVCEGVIVEAPVHASQRNFTRLAEPAKPDRVREPVRERQAALA
ncbi:hypothetical protein BCCGELA001_26765 [Bradyrhizobium sp. CCGE-LA001]|nr:hypothetical protein BCCGELA001_26765 [Bradyrhizobium sp. CCGE-LA001]